MSRIEIQTIASAAPEAAARLQAARQASGFVPHLLGVLANAPVALETYQTVTAINARGSLSAEEREVVQIAAAISNDCGFCVAGHTRIVKAKLRMTEGDLEGLRADGGLVTPRLDALADFTREVIRSRGQVSDAVLQAFLAAGFSQAQALEVVLGVSLATLCNYANNLAQTPINPELQPYALPAPAALATATPARLGSGLESIADYARQVLEPLAETIDREGFYPREFLAGLGQRGGFGADPGSLAVDLVRQLEVITEVARHCGATAFLSWCQSACAWYLAQAPQAAVRERHLAAVLAGERLAGTGMSNVLKHLAGIESIHLRARPDGEGYIVDGVLPWVSNLDHGHLLLTAARTGEGRYVMLAIDTAAEGVTLLRCPDFAGMAGTATRNVRLSGVRVAPDDVLAHPAQFDAFIAAIKTPVILLQVGIGLGVGTSCVEDIARDSALRREDNRLLDDGAGELEAVLTSLRQQALALAAAGGGSGLPSLPVLRLRATAAEWALRAAQSAVLHAGARGYLLQDPAQRRLREAVFVAIVTPAIKHLRKEIRDLGLAPAEVA